LWREIGAVTKEIAMHVPSAHSTTVDVEVVVPIVEIEVDVAVEVMVDKIGLVATGTLAARTTARI
jgi:hypothetical protein